MNKVYYSLCMFTCLVLFMTQVQASSVTLPNTFSPNTPAKAEEVNANFSAVKSAADDNDSRISALEAKIASLENTISTLQTQLSTVTNSNVMALEPYLAVDKLNDPRGPLVQFKGVNVQVVNGQGATATANGLGNIIIGYDEADTSGDYHCTIGTDATASTGVIDATTCGNAGGTWTNNGFKSGSHYLIVGSQNNYSRWGGVVIGYRNTSNYDNASVLGGGDNIASGSASVVSGGAFNFATGTNSSISGGGNNYSSGQLSSINGGKSNQAKGSYSVVTDGYSNTASGQYSSVTGGAYNSASTYYASVSGGNGNTASGSWSSVTGGTSNKATTFNATVSGGDSNTASGSESTVSGGYNRTASGTDNWAGGSYSAIQ